MTLISTKDENNMKPMRPRVSSRNRNPFRPLQKQKINLSVTIGKRSGVVIKNNIRKDSFGFEDLDAFWFDDDDDINLDESIPGSTSPPEKTEKEERATVNEDTKPKENNFDDKIPQDIHEISQECNSDDSIPEDNMDVFEAPHAEDDEPIPEQSISASPLKTLNDSITSENNELDNFPESPISQEHFSEAVQSPSIDEQVNPDDSYIDDDKPCNLANISFSKASTPASKLSSSKESEYITPIRSRSGYRYKDTPNTGDSILSNATTSLDESFYPESVGFSDEEDEDEENNATVDHDDSLIDASFVEEAEMILKDKELSQSDNDDGCVRRSKRRRFKPLEWYKGEHVVYERRQSGVGAVLPTVVGVERDGVKTPAKEKDPKKRRKAANRTKFPSKKLPEEYEYISTNTAEVWNKHKKTSEKIEFIRFQGTIDKKTIPTADGPSLEACQTFNIKGDDNNPGWVSGILEIPPDGKKEAERTNFTQVFSVLSGQPCSIEVAIARCDSKKFNDKTAQRYILSPGDEFYIPPYNSYLVNNHSSDSTCSLRFMLLKPSLHKQ